MRFLLNTMTHWEEPPRARHQVATALSKEHKVVFVAANKIGFPTLVIRKIHDNLSIIVPYFPIDSRIRYRFPILNELYQNWLFHKLIREYKDYEIINFDFTATRIYKFFPRVIYYCNDSFSTISKHINPVIIANYHRRCESEVARKARFCIAVSELIKENLRKYNPNSYEIPLGSPNIDEYNISINFQPERNLPIRVGFVGFIKTLNLSYNIINLLLEDEQLKLTLIGPVEDDFLDHVEKRDKLDHKGPLTGKALFEEINKFDVTIAPYSSRLIKDSNSGSGTGSKIYQYFSLGKPVVISSMAGLSKLKLAEKVLYIAKTESEFRDLVHKAFQENTTELIRERIRFAKDNTWDKRMSELIDFYSKHNTDRFD